MPRIYRSGESRLLERDIDAHTPPSVEQTTTPAPLQPLCPSCLQPLDRPVFYLCNHHLHVSIVCPRCKSAQETSWPLSTLFGDLYDLSLNSAHGDEEGR